MKGKLFIFILSFYKKDILKTANKYSEMIVYPTINLKVQHKNVKTASKVVQGQQEPVLY